MTLEILGIIVGAMASGCLVMIFEMFDRFGGGDEYFGSKPDVPKFPTSEEILAEMLKANSGALPGATTLAGQMDAANLGNWQTQVNQIAPSFMGAMSQAGDNIASRVRGEVPKEVQDAVQRSTAARSFMSGTGGGANTSWLGNLTGRDLGRTAFDIQRQGEEDLGKFGGVLKSLTPTTDVRSMLLSTPQVQNIMEQKWNEEWLRAKIAGAPDPVAKGRADEEMALLGMVLSIYGGGPGYQRKETAVDNPGGSPMNNAGQQGQGWNYGAPPVYGSPATAGEGWGQPMGEVNKTDWSPVVDSPWGGGLWG